MRKSVFCALVVMFCAAFFPCVVVGFTPDSPIVKDWMLQDGRTDAPDDAYIQACRQRRDERLKTLKETFPKIVFTKHFDLGGSHYAYTEAQSDAQAERNFVPGSALCVLEPDDQGRYVTQTLISDPNGVIRDPAVSHDGKTIVFAWKKSDRLDDYHLYDYDVDTGTVRQLTFGLGYADYEPCVLPDGDIVFNSTRCVQVVDCWWTEVSNLYRCDKDGRFLRRLTFDQVHTNFPSVLEDGRIIYTRWDYNDRGQIFPQSLFQMNHDGTAQTEYYGNNSYFPTTLMHSRGIPGSGGKVVSVFSGHHNRQYGKLGIVDIAKGRQENSGTQLIAPIRETKADRIDAWGQQGDRFAYPYPLNEREFLVGYNSDQNAGHTTTTPFGIFWIDEDGNRELLAYDPAISSHQPVPLVATAPPQYRSSVVNHELDYGVYTIQDVYEGPGMANVPRGTAKTIRVVALEFRSTGIGSNSNGGPAGGALVSTPISSGNGSWDVKIPLGNATVYEDGSASFLVPAKLPVYFQVLDENGHAIQTMRSWSTLQPGEYFSCIGCHENKNATTITPKLTEAMRRPPQPLRPFYDRPRGFSFVRDIQPILDKHCIACHKNEQAPPPFQVARPQRRSPDAIDAARAKEIVDRAIFPNLRNCRYTTEKPESDWMQPEYFAKVTGYPKSEGGFGSLPGRALQTPWETPDIWIWGTVTLPEHWKPQPLLMRYFHDENIEIYVNGKRLFQATGFNTTYEYAVLDENLTKHFKPGVNRIAAHVFQTGGGQGVDFGLWTFKGGRDPGKPQNQRLQADPHADLPFALTGTAVPDNGAKRNWPLSYLNLTAAQRDREGRYSSRQTPVVNWINVQDSPQMLPPYNAGAAKSALMNMLDPNLAQSRATHNDVALSREELDKIACWIDLLVPAFGDYFEGNAWDEHDLRKFRYYEAKKAEMHEFDRDNNLRFVSHLREGKREEPAGDPNAYRDLLAGRTRSAIPDVTGKLEFTSPIRTDQLVVTLSDGAPAGDCELECSNGFKQKWTLRSTAEPQAFRFPVQNDVSWIRVAGLSANSGVKTIRLFGIEKKDGGIE